jgi:hypothetical protein
MQPEFARIEIASQREANTVILQSNRRLVQKRDLASYAQSLFRFGNHLRRVSRTPKKRPHRYAGPFEARDSQAGKAPFAPSGLKPSPVQNSGLKRSHCSSLTCPGQGQLPPWLRRTNVWRRVISLVRGALDQRRTAELVSQMSIPMKPTTILQFSNGASK